MSLGVRNTNFCKAIPLDYDLFWLRFRCGGSSRILCPSERLEDGNWASQRPMGRKVMLRRAPDTVSGAALGSPWDTFSDILPESAQHCFLIDILSGLPILAFQVGLLSRFVCCCRLVGRFGWSANWTVGRRAELVIWVFVGCYVPVN